MLTGILCAAIRALKNRRFAGAGRKETVEPVISSWLSWRRWNKSLSFQNFNVSIQRFTCWFAPALREQTFVKISICSLVGFSDIIKSCSMPFQCAWHKFFWLEGAVHQRVRMFTKKAFIDAVDTSRAWRFRFHFGGCCFR